MFSNILFGLKDGIVLPPLLNLPHGVFDTLEIHHGPKYQNDITFSDRVPLPPASVQQRPLLYRMVGVAITMKGT